MQWIYSGQIPALHSHPEDSLDWPLFDLYVLADKFCIPDLMDQILDACLDCMKKCNWTPAADYLQHMHDCSTRKSSGMSRLVAALVCYVLCTYRYSNAEEECPRGELHTLLGNNEDLRLQVCKTLRAHPNGKVFIDPCERACYCDFYEHAVTDPCPRSMK